MDTRKLKLKRMFNGNHYLVGATSGFSRGLTDLYITNDGFGEYGCYDRIHAVFEDGRHIIFPASRCDEFELAQQERSENEHYK